MQKVEPATGPADPSERPPTCCQKFKFILGNTWKFWFTLFVPIVLCIVFLWNPQRRAHSSMDDFSRVPHAVYLLILMASYWVSECIPLAITSFIPIVLVPVFSIASSENICGSYLNAPIFFLFGGCIVALAFEYSDLHTRISFFVLKTLGAKPPTLLFGMMMTCMVLSCWMNNTSTTAMMVPVIMQIVEQYKAKMIPTETPEELARLFVRKRVTVIQLKRLSEESGQPSGESTLASNETSEAQNIDKDPPPPADKPPIDNAPVDDEIFQADVKYWEGEIQSNIKYVQNLRVMFLLGCAAASNIGGTGVITGTATNLIAQKDLNDYRREKREAGDKNQFKNWQDCFSTPRTSNEYWELDFAKWIQYNVLIMTVNTLLSWAFLSVYFVGMPYSIKKFFRTKICGKKIDVSEAERADKVNELAGEIRQAIRAKYKALGRTSFHQIMVFVLFLLLVCLWLFKNPAFGKPEPTAFVERHGRTAAEIALTDPKCANVKGGQVGSIGGSNVYNKLKSEWGWSRFFGDLCNEAFMHDYVPTMLVIVLLLIIPKEGKYYTSLAKLEEGLSDPLLTFQFICTHAPWGPLFLLGGGFAMSAALTEANLKFLMGTVMKESSLIKNMHQFAILALALAFVAVLTSIASNTATAVIMTPILIELAIVKQVPPMFLVIPPIVGASYAFCLPISTPPNAIVYDKGEMKQLDMFKPGLFLTILNNVVLYLLTLSTTYYMLGVHKYDGDCNYK